MKKGLLFGIIGGIFISLIMLLILSCGGGGGDGGSGQSSGTPATMSQATARQAMGIMQFGTTVGALYDDTGLRFNPGLSGKRVLSTQSMLNTVLDVIEQEILTSGERTGSDSGVESCPYGGTISLSASWEGPDYPSSCSQISNLNATISMNNCAVGSGSSMNGSATVSISGSACAPSAITIGFHNISFSDTYDDMSVAMDNLTISLTQITWNSGHSYVTHGRIEIDGDASGAIEGMAYQAEFDHFTQVMDTSDNVNFSATFSGSVSGGCLDGWVTIATLVPIAFSIYDNCPSAGQIRLSGDIDLLITINGDGTITAGDTDYADCNDFEMACAP